MTSRQRDGPRDDPKRGPSPARSPKTPCEGDRPSPGDRSPASARGPLVGGGGRDISCNSARAGQRSRAPGDGNAHGVPDAAITSGTKRLVAEGQVSGAGARTADRRAKVPEVYCTGRLSGGVLLVVVVDGGRGERGPVEDSKVEARSVRASWCGSSTPACPPEVEQVIGEATLRPRTGGGPSRGGAGGRGLAPTLGMKRPPALTLPGVASVVAPDQGPAMSQRISTASRSRSWR